MTSTAARMIAAFPGLLGTAAPYLNER